MGLEGQGWAGGRTALHERRKYGPAKVYSKPSWCEKQVHVHTADDKGYIGISTRSIQSLYHEHCKSPWGDKRLPNCIR